MGEVINLNRVRKARRKQIAALRAEENRARAGRTIDEKERDRRRKERLDREFEGKKLDD